MHARDAEATAEALGTIPWAVPNREGATAIEAALLADDAVSALVRTRCSGALRAGAALLGDSRLLPTAEAALERLRHF